MTDFTSYQYQPLSTEFQFRILRLEPGGYGDSLKGSLDIVDAADRQTDVKPWAALSYCWGNDQTMQHLIYLESGALSVTKSLYIALQHLRPESETISLWIDQISINQKDPQERAQQVLLMGRIYTSANVVIAWLGTGSTETKRILPIIDRLQYTKLGEYIGHVDYHPQEVDTCQEVDSLEVWLKSRLGYYKQPGEILPQEFRAALADAAQTLRYILQNPWFERVWIIQEAGLGSKLVLQCADQIVKWPAFWDAVSSLQDAGFLRSSDRGVYEASVISRLRFMTVEEMRKSRLLSLVWESRSRQATDHRDKVYALAGFLSRRALRGFRIDYLIPVEEAYKRFTLWALQTEGNLDVLMGCCAGSTKMRSYELPSWAADWSTSSDICGVVTRPQVGGGVLTSVSAHPLYRAHSRLPSFRQDPLKLRHSHAIDETGMFLGLPGAEIDVVAAVTERKHLPEGVGCPESDTWKEWNRLAFDQRWSKGRWYRPGNPSVRSNAYWRTLIFNRKLHISLGEETLTSATAELGSQYDWWRRATKIKSTADAMTWGGTQEQPASRFAEWVKLLEAGLLSKRLFVTDKGHLGIGCEHIRKGDRVFLLSGGRLPFILRPLGSMDGWFTPQIPTHSNEIVESDEVQYFHERHWAATNNWGVAESASISGSGTQEKRRVTVPTHRLISGETYIFGIAEGDLEVEFADGGHEEEFTWVG